MCCNDSHVTRGWLKIVEGSVLLDFDSKALFLARGGGTRIVSDMLAWGRVCLALEVLC